MSWGFDHWWGFLSGAAGQYDPIITQDNSTLGVPVGDDGGQYYFPDDITDKAVEWLHAVRAQDSEQPWMMFYSTGCAHAPHHVATEWADKYRGRFDDGWDALREQTLARQKELGIVPRDAELTERPDALFRPGIPSPRPRRPCTRARWRSTPATRRTPTGTWAGCWTPWRTLGDLDNTLIFYIWGDNGASLEGTTTGSFNELTFLNGLVLDADEQTRLIEKYGGVEALGGAAHGTTRRRGMGARLQHAVPVGQADCCLPRRHPRPDGRRLAQPARPGVDDALPVHPRDRHRPHDPGGGWNPRAYVGGRDSPGADGWHQLPLHPRRRHRGRAAHHPVLRDVR